MNHYKNKKIFSSEKNFKSFVSEILMYKKLIKEAISDKSGEQAAITVGGLKGFSGDVEIRNADTVALADQNVKIEGDNFTVHGVRMVSAPDGGVAANAVSLYQGAVDWSKSQNVPYSGAWETTDAGRAWIKDNIYNPAGGDGEKLAKLLGVRGKEAQWSSWFWSICYKNANHDYGDHRPWGEGGYDYGANEGYKVRQDVLLNPEKYIGKEVWMSFACNEAPINPGDSIFNWRADPVHGGSADKTFEDLGDKPTPSHMKVLGTDGAWYGGNESQKVGRNTKITLNGDKTLGNSWRGSGGTGDEEETSSTKYVAVYKRVKILGLDYTDNKILFSKGKMGFAYEEDKFDPVIGFKKYIVYQGEGEDKVTKAFWYKKEENNEVIVKIRDPKSPRDSVVNPSADLKTIIISRVESSGSDKEEKKKVKAATSIQP